MERTGPVQPAMRASCLMLLKIKQFLKKVFYKWCLMA